MMGLALPIEGENEDQYDTLRHLRVALHVAYSSVGTAEFRGDHILGDRAGEQRLCRVGGLP
jgi:hypothetical protein